VNHEACSSNLKDLHAAKTTGNCSEGFIIPSHLPGKDRAIAAHGPGIALQLSILNAGVTSKSQAYRLQRYQDVLLICPIQQGPEKPNVVPLKIKLSHD